MCLAQLRAGRGGSAAPESAHFILSDKNSLIKRCGLIEIGDRRSE